MKAIWIIVLLILSLKGYDQKSEQSFWEIYTEALRGNAQAQFNTGVIFERGLGREKNETKALEWYIKSAEQGNIDAQYNLGLMYLSGRGTEENGEQGEKWLKAAIAQGDKEALTVLKEWQKKQLKKIDTEKNNGSADQKSQKDYILKNTALICTKPSRGSECRSYPKGLIIASDMKEGEYIKISGMKSSTGLQPYTEIGWIHESDVSETDGVENSIKTMGQIEINATEIEPTTIITNKKAIVCEKPDGTYHCTFYKVGSALTSKTMSGDYYKISGIATKRGWQPQRLPRWIHKDDVEKRE